MGSYLPLIFATSLYILAFIYLIAASQVEGLREDWNSVRCQPMAMLLASYIPTDPAVNRSKFSSDNFQFCLQELVDSSIALVMIPIMGVFSTHLSTAKTTQQSINTMRDSASSGIANPFNSMMVFAWKKFSYIMAQVLRVFYKVNSSFQRIFGITISSVFAGFSLFKSINNTIYFFIKVAIILLIVIISLLFLIFIPIAPIIGILIIPTIIAIGATDYGGQVGGMQGSFNCVEPGTLVKGQGGWKPVESINLGESLAEGTVEGILYGKGGPAVKIHSVVISAMHIVMDEHTGRWVFAKDHTDAEETISPSRVYSLVTSTRTWTVRSPSDDKELLLRDWTHSTMRDDEAIYKKTAELVERSVGVGQGLSSGKRRGPGMGLIGPDSLVWKEGLGITTVSRLEVGDKIYDIDGTTEVTSIYRSTEQGNSRGPNDFVWRLASGGWEQIETLKGPRVPLMHIGTESGRCVIDYQIIRDFNEVDKEHYSELEDFLLSLLYH